MDILTFLKNQATNFIQTAPGVDPTTPGRKWIDETVDAIKGGYLTSEIVKESTTGALKGYARGTLKGLTLGRMELDALRSTTELEKEAGKGVELLGELEAWLIPFGVAEKAIGWAGLKAFARIPSIASKIPKIAATAGRGALSFGVINALQKGAPEESIWAKFGTGALIGAAFPFMGMGMKFVGKTKPLLKAIPKELESLAIEARKYKSAEEFVNKNLKTFEVEIRPLAADLKGKYGVKYPKLGAILDQDVFNTKTEALKSIGEKVSIKGQSLTDFYTQATKGIKEVAEVIPSIKPPIKPYQKGLMGEIEKMPELPKIEKNVLDWKPSNYNYNNPYTRKAYRVWDKMNQYWVEKAPSWAKTHINKEVEALTLERQRIVDGMTKRYHEDYVKKIQKLPLEEKKAVGMMVNKYIPVTKEYAGKIKGIDMEIGALGKTMVDMNKKWLKEGLITKEMTYLSEETFMEHLGQYARSFYLRAPKLAGRPPVLEPSRAITKGLIDRSMFKKKMTLTDWGRTSLEFEGKTAAEIGKISVKELEAIGLEAKKAYGWVYQGDAMLDRTFKDLTNNYATMQWQDTIVHSPSLFSKVSKEGFTKVSDLLPRGAMTDIRLGPLNNGYIHNALIDEVKFFTRWGADSVSKIIAEPLTYWKAFKVAGNPATVARNYISGGAIQTDMAGYAIWNPKNSPLYVEATKDYLTKSPFYKKLRDAGQYGADYFAVEIDTGMMATIEKSVNPMETLGAKLAEKVGKGLKTTKGFFSYYGSIDHIQRTYLSKCALRDGATLPQAIHFANKWELNYRFAPGMIDKMRTGVLGYAFPFISFYALMAPRIAEVLVTRPWVLAKYPAIMGAASYYGRTALGMTKEQDEAAKPRFLKGEPYVVTLPWKDANGNPVYLNMAYTLPFGSWDTAFMDWDALLDMGKGAGLAGMAHSLLTNYDAYYGQEIYDESDIPSVKKGKIAAYLLRGLSPGAVPHAMNIWKAAEGEVIGWPYPRERDVTQTALRAMGISTYTGGINEAVMKIRKLENEIKDINYALTRVIQNVNISDEEKAEKAEETVEIIQRKMTEINELARGLPPAPRNMAIPLPESAKKALAEIEGKGLPWEIKTPTAKLPWEKTVTAGALPWE